jgi:hypothetical protein
LVFESETEQTKCNSCERMIDVTSCDGLAQMTDYRVYAIGNDGHIADAIQLDCVDDNAAIQSAKLLVNGRDLELWQRARLIAKFERNMDGQ